MPTPDREAAATRYQLLVARVDSFHEDAASALGSSLTCHRGCSGCCQKEVAVFAIEAQPIAEYLRDHTVDAHESACPMLDSDGGCQIYPVRPLVCRTHGLPIRFSLEKRADMSASREERDVCPLNFDAGLDPWKAPEQAVLNIDVLNAQLVLLNRLAGNDAERFPVGRLLRPGS